MTQDKKERNQKKIKKRKRKCLAQNLTRRKKRTSVSMIVQAQKTRRIEINPKNIEKNRIPLQIDLNLIIVIKIIHCLARLPEKQLRSKVDRSPEHHSA